MWARRSGRDFATLSGPSGSYEDGRRSRNTIHNVVRRSKKGNSMKARHAVLPGRCGVVFGLVAALVCLFGGRAPLCGWGRGRRRTPRPRRGDPGSAARRRARRGDSFRETGRPPLLPEPRRGFCGGRHGCLRTLRGRGREALSFTFATCFLRRDIFCDHALGIRTAGLCQLLLGAVRAAFAPARWSVPCQGQVTCPGLRYSLERYTGAARAQTLTEATLACIMNS